MSKQSVAKPHRAKEGTAKAPLKTSGSHKNLSSTTQKGHISPNCPKKTQRAAHIEPIEETTSESEDKAEEVASEDWCAAARPTEDYALGRFLDRIERNPPVDEAELEDWSGLRGSGSLPSAYGMALHAVPYKDDTPHAYTASRMTAGNQVAYRQDCFMLKQVLNETPNTSVLLKDTCASMGTRCMSC